MTSGDVFGTRDYLKNDYLMRYAGAVLGLYGNSEAEAVYPMYYVDDEGEKLDASQHDYALRFEKDKLPPAGAFWSLTMYEAAGGTLIENPINRNLINSPMLPDLKRDDDGGLTFHLQHEPPADDKKANWLPAPDGPFIAELRIYLPQPEVLSGEWNEPPVRKVD